MTWIDRKGKIEKKCQISGYDTWMFIYHYSFDYQKFSN